MQKKLMLLGSGELGKEFTIAAQRLGQYIIAVDNYTGAPAMQVAHEFEVIDMLDSDALEKVVNKHQPDIIIPEIEAIRTEKLFEFENHGIKVVPCAGAVNYTMDRKAIRNLAAEKLKIKTANYKYAIDFEEFKSAVRLIGIPCVVKPLMSSSGKGQSIIRSEEEIEKAWEIATTKGRGDKIEVIVEEYINFESEITLLTVTQKNNHTLFCPPIGHKQERGDYIESWQPADVESMQLAKAKQMAKIITGELKGEGIWGVEFFLTEDEVYFSELSPRPHDTGMVTLAGSQNFNEFELHLRAILALPIPDISLQRAAASAVILSGKESDELPVYSGFDEAALIPKSDFRIFGKPILRNYRRMGVALAYDALGSDMDLIRERARKVAASIKIN
ncbi:MAG: formate-dependent phosphoribosylglycinamide formyltransferase [Bacteroidia bacterium]